MEKLIFTDQTKLNIDAIEQIGDELIIEVNNGDITELEGIFSDTEKLERIILTDEDGNGLSVFKNYSIFSKIQKNKNVIINIFTEEMADVVTIILKQIPDWKVAQLKQNEIYDSEIEKLNRAVNRLS